MAAVTTAFPHAPDLRSFLPPRERPSASILIRVHAEARTNADIAITTAEGDQVRLSASTVLQAAYTSYDAQGRLTGQDLAVHATAAQSVTSEETAITVAGDLSDEELADVHSLLENLGSIAADFLAGDVNDAVMRALDLGELDTLTNFDASFEYVQHVRVEQQYTVQEHLENTPASTETPGASAQKGPNSIERFLDSMMQVAEASQIDPETLAAALPKFTDRLMHTLINQYGADAPKTKLAKHVLTKLADHFNNPLASLKSA
jgi:hypothetical protein